MLVLRPAFDESDRNKLVKRVMHDNPVQPRKLNPSVPRDLETVVLKAIARDPAHRYQTPAQMAEDLKRFIEDRPVRARRITTAEQFWRWCRRNPLPASLLAGIVLVFLAGFVGVFLQWREADSAREDEKRHRGQADMARKGAETSRDEAEKSRAAAQAETYRAMLSEVRALRAGHEPGWREKALGDLARLAVMPTPRRDLPELRTEAAATLATPDIRFVAKLALPGIALGSFTFSPDDRTLLTADRQTGLDFWDVAGNRHLSSVESLMVSEGGTTHDKVVYLPDGQGFAVATDRGVVFTDSNGIRTSRAPITQGSSKPIKLSIIANGQRIAIGWNGGVGITIHDTASGISLSCSRTPTPALLSAPTANGSPVRKTPRSCCCPPPRGNSVSFLGVMPGPQLSPSAQMGPCSPPRSSTTPRSSGMWQSANNSAGFGVTAKGFSTWPSVRTASGSPRGVSTTPRESGKHEPGRILRRSPVFSARRLQLSGLPRAIFSR
jgi:hypothetical protein